MLFISVNFFSLLSSNILLKCYILFNYFPVDGHFGFQFLTVNKAGVNSYAQTFLCMYVFISPEFLSFIFFSHMYFQPICVFIFKVYLNQAWWQML